MTIRFGLFELDEEARELRRAGEVVPIQPKPFALLRMLVRERGRVVSSDELMEALWPEEVVTPASLNRAVSHARRALGDTGRGELIRSVPRYGYRFVAPVTETGAHDTDAGEQARHAGASDPPGAMAAARGRGFVGREEPLARLAAARQEVLGGATRLALIGGPAGIGKSRLVEEFVRDAAGHGFRVVTGRARDEEGVPAFWPWIQVLCELVEEPRFRARIAQGIGAGDLGPIVPVLRAFAPELAKKLPEPAGPLRDLSDEQHRFRFFDAVRRTLREGAREQPLVLVFEDLQWADAGSLRLLEHVAEVGDAPFLLLVTLREESREHGHRVHRTLAVLRQQPHCEPISLTGLSRGEVGAFLRMAAGRPAPVDLVSELYAHTQGVPLFVAEAIRLLEERGDLAQLDRISRRSISLPARSVEWVTRAIHGLGDGCLPLLGGGAVLGREFSLRAAMEITDTRPDAALDRADEAVRAGVLEEVEGHAGHYRFAHALFQEAVYGDLTGAMRARLHFAAARRLEQQHAGALEPVLSELAHHLHRAIAVVDPVHAHGVALAAARQCERLYAWEQAALHYDQAMVALQHRASVDPAERADLFLALGEAHRRSGDRDQRTAAFEQAALLARGLDDPPRLARAALGLCDVSEWSTGVHEKGVAHLREALGRIGDEDLVTRARLTARLAYVAVRDREVAEPVARDAVEHARRSGDPLALQESLYVLQYACAGPDGLEEREALVGELADHAASCRDRDPAVIACLDIACDGIIEGSREKVLEHRARAAELAGGHATPGMVWHLRVWDAGLALLEGRFAEAEQLAHDALLLGRRLQHPFAGACFNGQMCVLDRELGRDARIVERLEGRMGGSTAATHWSWAVLGRALAAVGEKARAREILDRLSADGFEDLARNIRWNAVIAETAMLAVELEAAEHAKPLLAQLRTASTQHGALPIPIVYSGPFTEGMAGLCAVLGLVDDAIALCEEALASARSLEARPTGARILLARGRLLHRAGRSRTAREAFQEAASEAEALGMLRVREAARAGLART